MAESESVDPPRTVAPEKLASYIRHLHTMDRSERAEFDFLKVNPSVLVADHEDWYVILENGFVDAMFEVLLSGHLCGFSQTELTSFTDEGCSPQYEKEIAVSSIRWTLYGN